MLKPKLFLGLSITKTISNAVQKSGKSELILRSDSRHLQTIELSGKKYIGKFAEVPVDMESVKLLQVNVASLLQKLILEITIDPSQLELIAVPDESN